MFPLQARALFLLKPECIGSNIYTYMHFFRILFCTYQLFTFRVDMFIYPPICWWPLLFQIIPQHVFSYTFHTFYDFGLCKEHLLFTLLMPSDQQCKTKGVPLKQPRGCCFAVTRYRDSFNLPQKTFVVKSRK